MRQRAVNQGTSEEKRLAQEAADAKAAAEALPPGPKRYLLMEKARRAETAAHIKEWVDSPGLRPPK